jgi:hypothetical protein
MRMSAVLSRCLALVASLRPLKNSGWKVTP